MWKELTKASNECGSFKELYAYRHGLAHGKYFNKSGLHDAAPKEAAAVVRALHHAIRTFAPDFPRT